MKRMLVAVAAVLPAGALRGAGPTSSVSSISVDYPSEGSLFPADNRCPDVPVARSGRSATTWRIEVRFSDRRRGIRLWSQGEKMKLGTRHQPDWSGCAMSRERRAR